jgi:hypothetical protein
MNHNYIYSDSVSCEQLKAVDIISKEEGRVIIEFNIHKVLFIVHNQENIIFNKQLHIAQKNKTATSQLGTLRQV